MGYKFQNELLQTAEEFIQSLRDEGISAAVVQDSFRDYTVKVSISKDDKSFGNVNLYYSPRRNSYSFRIHELKDKSIVPELEKCFSRLSPASSDVTYEVYRIYVDGSFFNDSVGYGVVILKNGEVVEELSGSVPDTFVQGTHQIAGELFATGKVIQWCQINSIPEVSIFYDLEGIEKWASGEWKTKHPLTRRYAEFIRNCGVQIHWHKVDSHMGDRWNERADELARKGVGYLSSEPDTPENSSPEMENIAKGFIQFLKNHGYKAELSGIYNSSNCAKIEISEADKSLGFINIYHTKKVPFLPRYHELKDKSYEDKLDSLWQEYYYGERRLL